MLPGGFVIVSVLIRLISGGRYAWGIIKGKAQPNAVTWFLWGLTPMIAFFAQLQAGFTIQLAVTLALGISPLVIFALTVARSGMKRHLTPFSISCGAVAVLGILLWKITDQPEIAIVFSILADIFASLPTLVKSYKDPSSEYAFPYLLSIISMAITLLTIQSWTFLIYAFPLYMLTINVFLYAFAALPLRSMVGGIKQRLALET